MDSIKDTGLFFLKGLGIFLAVFILAASVVIPLVFCIKDGYWWCAIPSIAVAAVAAPTFVKIIKKLISKEG